MIRILIIIAFLAMIQMDTVMPADKDIEPTREEMIEYAANLAEEMFSKLLGDEPITLDDEAKYFGRPFGPSLYFLALLGYLDNNGSIKIDLPHVSGKVFCSSLWSGSTTQIANTGR